MLLVIIFIPNEAVTKEPDFEQLHYFDNRSHVSIKPINSAR